MLRYSSDQYVRIIPRVLKSRPLGRLVEQGTLFKQRGLVSELSDTAKSAGAASGVSRRAVFSGLFVTVAVPVLARGEPDLHDAVRLNAEALAASMKALHGREWNVRIDHEQRVVLVMADS